MSEQTDSAGDEQTDPAGAMPLEAVSGRRPPELARAGAGGRPLAGDATGGVDRVPGPGARGLPGLGSPRLSHELRTPLNAILGNTELLLDGSAGPLSNEARACLGDIQAAGHRMLRAVQLLLDLCHARTRPPIADDGPLDLIGLLRAAQAAASRSGPGQAVHVLPASGRCLLRGDARWLRALATALVELHLTDRRGDDPLLVAVGQCPAPATTAAVRLWWRDFDPDQVAALPIALIDAILDLHGGRVALTAHGLQLDWPAPGLTPVGPLATGCGRDRNGS